MLLILCCFRSLFVADCCISLTILIVSLEASDLLQNLSLDSQAEDVKISEPAKKVYLQTHFYLSSNLNVWFLFQFLRAWFWLWFHHVQANAVTGKLQSTDRTRSTTPSLKDSTMPYHPNGYSSSAYYYGGNFLVLYSFGWVLIIDGISKIIFFISNICVCMHSVI